MASPVRFESDYDLAIHATDLVRAAQSCSGVLGLRLKANSDQQLGFDAGVLTLYVNLATHAIPLTPALEVEDYQRAKEYLIEHGCKIVREFPADKALYSEDPFGIVIDIVEK